MKVAELREKLSKLDKEEIARLAVEFYKLIPKSKKEDYNIDELISNPKQSKAKSKKIDEIKLAEMQIGIKDFIEHARDMCYISPNRIVPKKERAGWRFKAKRWHKELMKKDRNDGDLKLQAKLLRELYELLCESCNYQYFTAYDTFESVGVDQAQFFADIIDLYHEATGKLNTIEIGIHLMADNALNRYTLYSDLMEILITKHDLPDLKYKGIEYAKMLIKKKGYQPKPKTQRSYGADSYDEYSKKENHNNLTEMVVRLYLSLFESKEAIEFFHKNYFEDSTTVDIKQYILTEILLYYKLKAEIKEELEKARAHGVKLRDNLIKLLQIIENEDRLPEQIPY
jgi:hypothetical protein